MSAEPLPHMASAAELDVVRASRELADLLDAEKRAVDAWLVDALALRSTDVVLEVACGTAGCGLAIAEALAPTGSVLCSDRSTAMLDAAREVAAERQVRNVEFLELDGQSLDLPDGCVDGVVSRLGFMVMADPAAALAEAWRVLRPGRRLALSVWSERTHNPWRAIPEAVLFGTPATTAPGDEQGAGPFALADLQRLGELLESAGFTDVRTAHIRADHRYTSFDEYWATCQRKSSSVRRAYEALDAGGREETKDMVLQQLRGRTVGSEGFVIPAEMLVAAAVKPGA